MSEDGKKRLRDLAQQAREKVTNTGAPVNNARGIELVDELAKELGSPEGMPGLKVYRDNKEKFRLQRSPKPGEIVVEWQRDIQVLAVICEKQGQPKSMVRYVYDESAPLKWRRLDGGGDVWEDITTALIDTLYPEMKKPAT